MPKATKSAAANHKVNGTAGKKAASPAEGKTSRSKPGKQQHQESVSKTLTNSRDLEGNGLASEEYDSDELEAAGDPGGAADDPRERRQLRHEYRNLMEETQKQRQELINPEKEHDQLHEILQRQNEMFTRVKHTREAALDSTQLATVAHLAKQKAQNLHTDFVVFQPYEFAEKLISFLSGHRLQDQRTRISNEGWEKLGEAVQPFFKRSPSLNYMYGAFEKGPPKAKERKRPERSKNEETTGDGIQAVKKINNENVAKEEATTQEVEKILAYLQTYYDMWERNPICFFEFVVNPESFGQTIENIFYTSFLIRDGHARVFLDEDKLPVIEPVANSGAPPAEGDRSKHQVVMSITYKQWKELIETFNIERPLIPTRAPTSPQPERRRPPSVPPPRGGPHPGGSTPGGPASPTGGAASPRSPPGITATTPATAEEPSNNNKKKQRVGTKGKGVGKNR